MRKKILTVLASLCLCASAWAVNDTKICMILDKAGKDDNGFNQSAYRAFQKALDKQIISKDSHYVTARDERNLQQIVRSFVVTKGMKCDAIFVVGFNNAESVKDLALQYADQKFVVIDAVVDRKNVRSLVYREDQGAFLVGAIAAMKSKTHQVGFVGGMEVPLIKRFETAYVAGAKYKDPQASVVVGFVGLTIDAWNNPTKAQEIAMSQYEHGADVIFQAAGGSGFGVFNAVEKINGKGKAKKYAIGCDTNQNGIKPGLILTSMVKGIETSTLDSIEDVVKGRFTAGVKEYNLGNQGVDWVLDDNNRNLFSAKDLKEINRIKTEIISGKIYVPDYYKTAAK